MTYRSTQSAEVLTHLGGYHETILQFDFTCTYPGQAPSYNPMDGGDPGSDPEFDLDTISLEDDGGNCITINPDTQSVALDVLKLTLGSDVYQELEKAAYADAVENYRG